MIKTAKKSRDKLVLKILYKMGPRRAECADI